MRYTILWFLLYGKNDAFVRLYCCRSLPVNMSLSRWQLSVLENDSQDALIIALLYKYIQSKKKKKRNYRWWVHSIIKKRKKFGAYYHLVKELELDGEKFQEYFRMTREKFSQVLFYVEKDLVKHSKCREVICPRQRLAICVRYVKGQIYYISLCVTNSTSFSVFRTLNLLLCILFALVKTIFTANFYRATSDLGLIL